MDIAMVMPGISLAATDTGQAGIAMDGDTGAFGELLAGIQAVQTPQTGQQPRDGEQAAKPAGEQAAGESPKTPQAEEGPPPPKDEDTELDSGLAGLLAQQVLIQPERVVQPEVLETGGTPVVEAPEQAEAPEPLPQPQSQQAQEGVALPDLPGTAETETPEFVPEQPQAVQEQVVEEEIPQAQIFVADGKTPEKPLAGQPQANGRPGEKAVEPEAKAVQVQDEAETPGPKAEMPQTGTESHQDRTEGFEPLAQAPKELAKADEPAKPQEGRAEAMAKQEGDSGLALTQDKTTGKAQAVENSINVQQEQGVAQAAYVPQQTTPDALAEAPNLDVERPDFSEAFAETVLQKADTGATQFDIDLYPRELGKVTVSVQIQAGQAVLSFICENAKSQSILNAHAGAIGSLIEQNTGRQTVVQPPEAQQQEGGQENYDGHNKQQQQQQEQPRPRREQVGFFIDQLKSTMLVG